MFCWSVLFEDKINNHWRHTISSCKAIPCFPLQIKQTAGNGGAYHGMHFSCVIEKLTPLSGALLLIAKIGLTRPIVS